MPWGLLRTKINGIDLIKLYLGYPIRIPRVRNLGIPKFQDTYWSAIFAA
jgi:hypothetical protein